MCFVHIMSFNLSANLPWGRCYGHCFRDEKLRKVNQLASGHTARKMRLEPRQVWLQSPCLKHPLFLNSLFPMILQVRKLSPREGWRHAQCHLAFWNQHQTRTQISWAFLLYHTFSLGKRGQAHSYFCPVGHWELKVQFLKRWLQHSRYRRPNSGHRYPMTSKWETGPSSYLCNARAIPGWFSVNHGSSPLTLPVIKPCYRRTPPDSPANLSPCLLG